MYLRVHCWGKRKRVRDESVMENVGIIRDDWMQHVVLDTDICMHLCVYAHKHKHIHCAVERASTIPSTVTAALQATYILALTSAVETAVGVSSSARPQSA